MVLDFSSAVDYIPTPVEKVNKNYVMYGEENDFPNYVLKCVDECSFLGTLIGTAVDYVTGDGMTCEEMNVNTEINDKDQTLYEVVRRTVYDYITFGSFALQVLRNPYGDIKKLVPLKVENIRTNEDETEYYYSSKWGKYSSKSITYEKFDKNNRNQKNSILYVKAVNSRNIYGKAPWFSALRDATILMAINEFNEASLANGFAASTVISLCEGKPTPEEMKKVEDQFRQKFSGSKNASKFILTFSDSKEGVPQFNKIGFESFVDQYKELQLTSRDNLFAAFRMNPILTGIKTTDGIFSEDQFKEAFALYNKTVIQPLQKDIKKVFKKCGLTIDFLPFTVDWPQKDNTNTEGVLNNEKNISAE